MDNQAADIGLIGLGTMGANLALNIAENGFKVAVHNRTVEKIEGFMHDAGPLASQLVACDTVEELIRAIKPPRAVILMVPAGPVVDEYIATLRALMDDDDIVIDAGNANFQDTNRRAASGAPFLGIGVSGGEEGARFGPSIMGGGRKVHWDRVAPILQAIAADYQGTPCATWMGEGGAGHAVKTVHNGIEYADMQMIAEAYGIMRDGMGLHPAQIGDVFEGWNTGVLKSYLMEISATVSKAVDPQTNAPVLDIILDRAGQKGTGRWTAIEAQHLGVPATVIEAAVAARNLSSRLEMRQKGESLFGAAPQRLAEGQLTIDTLGNALIAGKIMCYTQGFELLAALSAANDWTLPMPEIAKVWREGCIIRSTMLNDMANALSESPDANLMFSDFFARLMRETQTDLRQTVSLAAQSGLPAPALSAGLSYFDMMRTSHSTANLIQAQRDFFGAHGFERRDAKGAHHGPWGSNS
ncbi:MAG: NADP-dependent phosphogluconate dehydrogenase [Rhizobiaceae bacterium]|nr:NADP-dependent phosphogluconate dehydrogenase [Rhizobiaceae bacterium]